MATGLIIFFIVIGLLFLLIEILVTPGIILGVIGLGFISYGVYQTYQEFGNTIGNWVLIGSAFVTVTVVLLALKAGVWSRVASKDVISSKAREDVVSFAQVGDKGKTLSALRPSGTGFFNGKKVEISSEGEAVEAGVEVEVIRIEQNKIFIKRI
jgi:membrane-bound ClpP family serine protease